MSDRPTRRKSLRSRGTAVVSRAAGEDGFSLVEVIVAMVVLTIGLLGLAAGTGWMIRTVHFGELETERSAALQSAIEQVRSRAFTDVADGSATFGEYNVEWEVGAPDQHNLSRPVRFIVVGPGRSTAGGGLGEISETATDTFDYHLLRR